MNPAHGRGPLPVLLQQSVNDPFPSSNSPRFACSMPTAISRAVQHIRADEFFLRAQHSKALRDTSAAERNGRLSMLGDDCSAPPRL